MCWSSCIMLYEEGMDLKDITCPCNCGYWDVFSEAFVSGDQVRHGRAPSRSAYEAKVKARTSPGEYEAMLRKQFIKHFLDCEYKRKLDESDPSNDGSTRRRAEAELREISNGDFISRGRTASRGSIPTPIRSGSRGGMLGSDRHEVSVDRHRDMQARQRSDTDPVRSRTRDDPGELSEEPKGRNQPSYAQSTTTQQFAATARQPAGSAAEILLSPLSSDFVSIPKGDFAASRTFILRNPKVMDEDATALLRAAIASLKAGQGQHARSCVEKAVMINECAGLSSKGMRDFLQRLTQNSAARADFIDTFDDAFRKLRQRAEASGPVLASSLPIAVPTSTISRHGYMSQEQPLFVPSAIETRPAAQRSFSGPLETSLGSLSISTSARHGSLEPSSLSRTQSGDQTRPTTRRGHNFHDRPLRSPSPSSVELKGTEGDSEELDPRYRKRRDAKSFFSVGRVFAILYHESIGNRQEPGPEVKFTRHDRYGEKIVSSIRRMVVVRQREGYCWCLDIKTYGGLGVAKPGMTLAEIRAHSVIHDERKAPRRKADEKGLDKDPIAVTMAPEGTLPEMSRLNFAAVHTVAWNVKVMNVGKVSKNESMTQLVRYWRDEMEILEREI